MAARPEHVPGPPVRDLAAREAQHFNDPVLGDFRFQVEYRTDVYEEQRGLEQILYDRYPGAQFNKIRAINPANYDKLANYIERAFQYLGRLGGG